MASPPAARRAPFLGNLEALRGIAALLVVLLHSPWMTPLATWPPVRQGWSFVDLFFVLSGFVIALNYAGSLKGVAGAGRFMLRRAWRLYPLHLVALAACVLEDVVRNLAMPALHLMRARTALDGVYWGQALASALLVSGLGAVADPGPNGPSWSISTEMFAYLVFAIISLAVPRRRLAGVFLLVSAAAYLALQALQHGSGLDGPLQFRALRCLFSFGIGVACCDAYLRSAADMGRGASLAVQLVAWSGVAAVLWRIPAGGWISALLPPLFAVAIYGAARDPGSALKHMLEAPPLRRLGQLSYSIYLVHSAVENALGVVFNRLSAGDVVHDGVTRLALPAPVAALAMTLYVGGTIALSALTYRWIEQPGREMGRRLADWLQRPRPRLGERSPLSSRTP